MKLSMRIFVLFLFFYVPRLYSQCALYEIPLTERLNAATLVLEGRVVDNKSFREEGGRKIFTSSKIEIFKIFKGDFSQAFIEIITEGGVVGDEMLVVSNHLFLKKGDAGIFMLRPVSGEKANSGTGGFEAVASMQGFIRYDGINLGASDVFARYENAAELYEKIAGANGYREIKAFPGNHLNKSGESFTSAIPVITGFEPEIITAGTNEVLTIRGSGFGNTRGDGSVGFRNADDGGATFVYPLPEQFVTWQDNLIVVEVPQNAGTGKFIVNKGFNVESADTLLVLFALLNVVDDDKTFLQQMISKSPSGGYVWQMSELFSLFEPASASFKRAFNTWKCNTGVNWLVGEDTTLNVTERDEVNIIRFDTGNELPEGVLATTLNYYSACQASQWYLSEMDMVFINNIDWQFGPGLPAPFQFDMETIALHELGHAHQLGHVLDPEDVMHYSYEQGGVNRELNVRNIAGGDRMMQESTFAPICGFEPMEGIPFNICTIPELSAFTFNGLKIFPNPVATPVLNIQYTLSEKYAVNLELFDMLGQKILTPIRENQEIGIYNYEIDMRMLDIAGGIYFLRLYLNNTKYTYKIIKK